MAESFLNNGLAFSCQQCSGCCRHDPGFVYLSREDLDLFLKILSISQEEFIEKYCRFVPYYDGGEVLCLKEKKNYDCIFWDNGCTAYEARPVQCRTYPFWSYIIKNEEAWITESKSCPGINKGSIHSCGKILAASKQNDENKVLYKKDILV